MSPVALQVNTEVLDCVSCKFDRWMISGDTYGTDGSKDFT